MISREYIEKELKKLTKLKYNQFRWWRMYEPKRKPLHNRKPLRDKILNGDFDYSCYKLQADWCDHEINDLWEELKPDHAKFIEQSSLLRTRKNRLLQDFERDEQERLSTLVEEFTKNFKINKDQVYEEMENYSGSLIDFYYYIDEKYKINFTPYPFGASKRGRPKKS